MNTLTLHPVKQSTRQSLAAHLTIVDAHEARVTAAEEAEAREQFAALKERFESVR